MSPAGGSTRGSTRTRPGGANGSSSGSDALLWVMAGAAGTYVLADAAVNLGLSAASAVAGGRRPLGASWSWRAVVDLGHAKGSPAQAFPALGASWGATWGATALVVFWVVAGVVFAAAAAVLGWCAVAASWARREARQPYRAMAGRVELRDMIGGRAVKRARQLRPSVADTAAVKTVPLRDRGFAVGVPMGPERDAPQPVAAASTRRTPLRPRKAKSLSTPRGMLALPVAFPARAAAGTITDRVDSRVGAAPGAAFVRTASAGPQSPASCVARRDRRGQRLTWLHLSAEEVALAYMAPRSGKTTGLAIPAIIEAPGPVFVTGNKGDVVAATRRMRERDTGESTTLFDPMGIMVAQQRCWFDLLGDVTTARQATKLAGYFMDAMQDDGAGDSSFWRLAGHDLLSGLILAAAVSPGRTLLDVMTWLGQPADSEPAALLRAAGQHTVAAQLSGRQAGAPETIGGIYENARVAAACLQDERMRAWVTPQPHLPVFDAASFVRSVGTIYLLSKDEEAVSAAPLVAAVTGQILTAASTLAERSGGRMDPPLTGVLDEAANICRLKNLPKLYSYSGSRGINLMTILQSKAQGEGVWGQTGMKALESAATVKLYGSGLQDTAHAGELSKLVGQWDVRTTSVSSGRGSGASRTTSTRREDILPIDAIAALPKQVGLMIVTGIRPAMIRYVPWWMRDYGLLVTRDLRAEVAALRERANDVGVDWRDSQLVPADLVDTVMGDVMGDGLDDALAGEPTDAPIKGNGAGPGVGPGAGRGRSAWETVSPMGAWRDGQS